MDDGSTSDPDPSSIKSAVNQSLSRVHHALLHNEASLFAMITKLLWKCVRLSSGSSQTTTVSQLGRYRAGREARISSSDLFG